MCRYGKLRSTQNVMIVVRKNVAIGLCLGANMIALTIKIRNFVVESVA